MADERKRAIAETFGAAADTYGRTGPDFFWPLGRALVDWAGVGPGDRVLDVATGTGALAVAAVERGAEAIGIDLADRMVDAARANGVDACVMDAETPSFDEASFDRVLCGFGIFFLPNPGAALRSWRALLRPGGSLALSTFVRRDPRWAWTVELLPPVSRPTTADDAFDDSREGLEAQLVCAGYVNVRFAERTHQLLFSDADEWWAWLWSHGHRRVLSRLADGDRESYRAAAYERIAAMDPIEYTIWARFTAAERP
jgi:ubiquinone/menaquinone biosynthesis C-methylase UbiE